MTKLVLFCPVWLLFLCFCIFSFLWLNFSSAKVSLQTKGRQRHGGGRTIGSCSVSLQVPRNRKDTAVLGIQPWRKQRKTHCLHGACLLMNANFTLAPLVSPSVSVFLSFSVLSFFPLPPPHSCTHTHTCAQSFPWQSKINRMAVTMIEI